MAPDGAIERSKLIMILFLSRVYSRHCGHEVVTCSLLELALESLHMSL